MTTTAPEQRTITAPVQDVRAEGRTLRGFAALYGVESRDLGGYRETIAPGAFSGVLAGDPDVALTFNHDPSRILARTASGTLRLRDDEQRGLAFEADLGDGPTAQDVRDMVRRGDVSGASFRFVVASDGERWEGEQRTLTRIGELIDLSLATTPAYDGPRVELRSAPEQTPEAARAAQDTHEAEEAPMQTEDRQQGAPAGGLVVEDRTARVEERTAEQRVMDELRTVSRGESRALSVSANSAVAPADVSTVLFDRLRPSSVMLQSGIRVVETDRSEVTWPQLVTDVSPDFYAEAELIIAGDPAFATLTATPRKIAHRVEASNEIIDDSDPSIVEVLTGHLAQLLALKLDSALLAGNPATNADSIRGLRNVAGIQTVASSANGDALANYDKFVQAVGLLAAANVPGPFVAIGHPRTATALALLRTATGSNEALARPQGIPEMLTTTQLSTAETKGTSSNASSAYVFAPAQLVVVRRQDASIELDRSRLFSTDQSELRGKLRADLLCPNPQAIVRIDGIIPAA